MASALSNDRLLAALRREGCKVVERAGWRTRRRPAHTGGFGPINGVMIHHTVTSGDLSSVELCERGHSELPGPLCQIVIGKSGIVYLISNGRANHAGKGDPDILRMVQEENYTRDRLLVPNEATTDGNDNFYGMECVNLGNGRDPWPEAQRDAIVRAAAAILREYGGPTQGWTAKSAIGHLEWQPGKIDPRTGSGGVDVSPPVLRRLIDERLAHPASWTPGSTSTPAPSEEDDMPLTAAEKTEIAKLTAAHVRKELLLTDFRYKAPKDAADYNPDPESSRHWWAGQTIFEVLINTVRQTATDLTALAEKVDDLEAHALTDAQIAAIAAAVAANPALADAIADKLAARLAD